MAIPPSVWGALSLCPGHKVIFSVMGKPFWWEGWCSGAAAFFQQLKCTQISQQWEVQPGGFLHWLWRQYLFYCSLNWKVKSLILRLYPSDLPDWYLNLIQRVFVWPCPFCDDIWVWEVPSSNCFPVSWKKKCLPLGSLWLTEVNRSSS